MTREEETTHPCYKPVCKTKKHIAEEAKRFSFLYPSESKEMFFIYGAEWAKKIMLDRACKWLKTLTYQEFAGAPLERLITDELIAEFRQAMEGE